MFILLKTQNYLIIMLFIKNKILSNNILYLINKMQDKIYKINNISLDEKNQEFCLSHDHGIKTFDLEQFTEAETSENYDYKLGSISLARFFSDYQDLIIFIGSKNNKDFPPNTLVIFNIKKKKIILKKAFDKEITNIKCASSL